VFDLIALGRHAARVDELAPWTPGPSLRRANGSCRYLVALDPTGRSRVMAALIAIFQVIRSNVGGQYLKFHSGYPLENLEQGSG